MEQYKELLKKIDLLSQLDSAEFVMLAGPIDKMQPRVDRLSRRAALVCFDTGGGSLIHDWLPFSQLRCDPDGTLYLAEWLFRQKVANNV